MLILNAGSMKTLWWFPALIFCSITESFTQTLSSHSSSTTAQVSLKVLGITQEISAFITKSNPLNYFRDTLAGSKTDASGHSVLLFPLLEPTFAEIRIGNRKSDLYLTPGDDLVIHVDLANSNFIFTGKGAEPNHYLSQSAAIRQKNIIYKGQYINELKTVLFISQLDTLAKAFRRFHSQYIKAHPLQKHVSNILKANNELFIHSFAQNYADAYFGTFEQRDKMPKRLTELTNHIYFDTTLLHTGMVNYLAMLQDYYYKKFYNPLFKRTDTPQKIDSIRHILPQTAHTNIQKSTLLPLYQRL